MVQPTPEQWAVLTPMERFAYRLGDVFSRKLPWISILVTNLGMKWVVWVFGGRRFIVHGQEHLDRLRREDRVLLVANHRSFFDFYVTMCTLWLVSKAPRRIVFPVRSTYFYDNPTGPFVNLCMSGFSMFPPILRDHDRGLVFNRFSQDRMAEEIGRPGTVLGMHPEGTRNKGPDPYDLLPPKPGTGRIIRRAPEATTILPVFVLGMTNNAWHELWLNWTRPDEAPIDLVFGAPVDVQDLMGLPDDHDTHMRIVERCMIAISALAKSQRMLRHPEQPRKTGTG
jgi:1-acyl-sn-glycerol-3-phosphate acyltransferase